MQNAHRIEHFATYVPPEKFGRCQVKNGSETEKISEVLS
jgi:hypothetical protein